MHYQDKSLNALKLGQQTKYAEKYDRTLLQPVPRRLNRDQLNITATQPFTIGADIWTAYEISWLNPKGVPQVAIADVSIDFRSENLIESKSFKLYLNSFNQTTFADFADVQQTLQRDLQDCAQGEVRVRLNSLADYTAQPIVALSGECIDAQDIEVRDYAFNATLLNHCTGEHLIEETLVSHSNLTASSRSNQTGAACKFIMSASKLTANNYCATSFPSANITNSTSNASSVFSATLCNTPNRKNSPFTPVIPAVAVWTLTLIAPTLSHCHKM